MGYYEIQNFVESSLLRSLEVDLVDAVETLQYMYDH